MTDATVYCSPSFEVHRVTRRPVAARPGFVSVQSYVVGFAEDPAAARREAARHGPGRYEVWPVVDVPDDLAEWPEAAAQIFWAAHGLDRDEPVEAFDWPEPPDGPPAGVVAAGAA